MSGLFRHQAVQAVQSQWLGRVLIAQPPALRWLIGGVLVAVLCTSAFLGAASYTRKLSVPGVLVSDPSRLPTGPALQAQLYSPSRSIGVLRSGQAVRLRLDAYPQARFGHLEGRVLTVEPVPLGAADQPSLFLPAQPPGAEPLLRINVALDALPPDWSARPLAPGLRVQADLLLERRRLAEWLFEPLVAVASRR